jgi:hypothetical protein
MLQSHIAKKDGKQLQCKGHCGACIGTLQSHMLVNTTDVMVTENDNLQQGYT